MFLCNTLQLNTHTILSTRSLGFLVFKFSATLLAGHRTKSIQPIVYTHINCTRFISFPLSVSFSNAYPHCGISFLEPCTNRFSTLKHVNIARKISRSHISMTSYPRSYFVSKNSLLHVREPCILRRVISPLWSSELAASRLR